MLIYAVLIVIVEQVLASIFAPQGAISCLVTEFEYAREQRTGIAYT